MTSHQVQSGKDRRICMNCLTEGTLKAFIDLGDQPNGNNFPSREECSNEPLLQMKMMVCSNCWQVQISQFPSQEFLFSKHPYVTGINVPVVQHFRVLVEQVCKKLKLPQNSLVFDIGANDGTLLSLFRERGMRVVGFDPGQITGELARANGITVCPTFWSSSTARSVAQLGLAPDVITATAVFYHVPDLHDFVAGLKQVMTRNSTFVVQCVHMLDVLEKNQFDHFYHEHSCIHAVTPLHSLFSAHGLRILDAERWPIHGGSFVLYVGLEDHPMRTEASVEKMMEDERAAGLCRLDAYEAFTARVERNKVALRTVLQRLKDGGKVVYALGAPAKGNTLLNFCQVTSDLVKCATEINPYKIGRLTPGMHIPVVDERTITDPPDYYLVLSWNFLDFLLGKYRDFLLRGGRFIVPVPEVRIVGFESVPV